MSARMIDPANDPIRPGSSERVRIRFDGEELEGIEGQSIAGVLLANGRQSWRVTPNGEPRGVFCGIGVCFDCLCEVDGMPDVRACQRTAVDGQIVEIQRDRLPTQHEELRGQHDGLRAQLGADDA